MLQYGDYHDIAYDVLEKLNLPDYKDLTPERINELNELLKNDALIDQLIEEAMVNYDTSDNIPSDVEDIKNNTADEVFFTINDLIDSYSRAQEQKVFNAYEAIVEAIKNANIPDVVEVEAIYEPDDPSVGIFNEERAINIVLSTGDYIIFDVEFDWNN